MFAYGKSYRQTVKQIDVKKDQTRSWRGFYECGGWSHFHLRSPSLSPVSNGLYFQAQRLA
jgi:hypothetical protein